VEIHFTFRKVSNTFLQRSNSGGGKTVGNIFGRRHKLCLLSFVMFHQHSYEIRNVFHPLTCINGNDAIRIRYLSLILIIYQALIHNLCVFTSLTSDGDIFATLCSFFRLKICLWRWHNVHRHRYFGWRKEIDSHWISQFSLFSGSFLSFWGFVL
jgi:hypothetical protein